MKIDPFVSNLPSSQTTPSTPSWSRRALLATLAALGLGTRTFGQDARANKAKKKSKEEDEEELQPSEEVVETEDGVLIGFTYYPSKRGKDAPVAIFLHGEKETGDMFEGPAKILNSDTEEVPFGFACATIDLRGFGRSTKYKLPDGTSSEIAGLKLNGKTLVDMVQDVNAVKRFLRNKNNEGKLNIERLVIFSSGFSTVVAAGFASYDWAADRVETYKPGQDVKSLIMLSPMSAVKGFKMSDAIGASRMTSEVSLLLVHGSQETAEAKKVSALFSKRPKAQKSSVVTHAVDAKLVGLSLFEDPSTLPAFVEFIQKEVLEPSRTGKWSWSERKKPN